MEKKSEAVDRVDLTYAEREEERRRREREAIAEMSGAPAEEQESCEREQE